MKKSLQKRNSLQLRMPKQVLFNSLQLDPIIRKEAVQVKITGSLGLIKIAIALVKFGFQIIENSMCILI